MKNLKIEKNQFIKWIWGSNISIKKYVIRDMPACFLRKHNLYKILVQKSS